MQVDDIGWARDSHKGQRGERPAGRDRAGQRAVCRYPPAPEHVQDRDPAPAWTRIRRLPVVLPARSFLHPEATALSEQERYNYDWSGFRFTVSPRWFRGTGEWQCYMLVRGHGVWRPARVHTPVPGPAERPQPRQVAPGLRFGARWAGLGLNVAAWRLGAVVAALAWHDADPRAAEIDVEMPGGTGPEPRGPTPVPGVLGSRPSWCWCATGGPRPGRSRLPPCRLRTAARPGSARSSG